MGAIIQGGGGGGGAIKRGGGGGICPKCPPYGDATDNVQAVGLSNITSLPINLGLRYSNKILKTRPF